MKKIILAVMMTAALTLTGCGMNECGPNEIRSEDHGCIDKDDLDLNDNGSFEDEESEWDED